jgi:hypothetical protein
MDGAHVVQRRTLGVPVAEASIQFARLYPKVQGTLQRFPRPLLIGLLGFLAQQLGAIRESHAVDWDLGDRGTRCRQKPNKRYQQAESSSAVLAKVHLVHTIAGHD